VEVLEDRNCPAVVINNAGTIDFTQDPTRNVIVAQATTNTPTTVASNRLQNDPGRGDITQFNQGSDFGRENLSSGAATDFTQREIENVLGTPENVWRFLLQIDPMTPMPSIPLDQQTPGVPLPTANIGNVGSNTVIRATASVIGGSNNPELLPDAPLVPFFGLMADQETSLQLDEPTELPLQTLPRNANQVEQPEQTEQPDMPEELDPRATLDVQPARLKLLPPQENPHDVIGVVFSGFVPEAKLAYHGTEPLLTPTMVA